MAPWSWRQSLCESDEQIHCLLEFLYTLHQAMRLAGDWGLHLLSPMLQSPCIGDGMMQLGKTDVLGTEPCIPQQQKAVLANGGVCASSYRLYLFTFFAKLHALGTSRRHTPSGQSLGGQCGWGSLWASPSKTSSVHTWCTTIQSEACRGRAPDLQMVAVVGGNVGIIEGGRPSPAMAPAGEGSSSPRTRSSWRWGSSGGGHLSSTSSSSTRMVWGLCHGLDQSVIPCGVASVCHTGGVTDSPFLSWCHLGIPLAGSPHASFSPQRWCSPFHECHPMSPPHGAGWPGLFLSNTPLA